MMPMSPERRSVLIVDDTEDMRLLLRLALERAGAFTIVGEAGDGRTAVELAATLQPDAVLLDLAMPVMDGLQALPLVRQASPASCVVVLSGFNGRQLAAEAAALGAHGYIEKGVRPADLVARLWELCEMAGSPAPEPEASKRGPPPAGDPAVPDPARLQNGHLQPELFDWLALLCHELTTPLTAISGSGALLEEHWTTMEPEMVQRSLAGIGRSARYMQTMLSNYTSACEVDLEGLELLLEDIDVTQLVSETVADLAGATSAARILLVLPGPVPARIGKTRVRQVVTNLVSKAVKFAGPGGVVVLSSTVQRPQSPARRRATRLDAAGGQAQ
jgi:CheY-like chemotaxis protein